MGWIIAEVTVVPLGTCGPGLSKYVAEVEKVLRSYGLKTTLTPMSTIIEGEWDRVFEAIKAMHERPFEMGALRVSTRITVDERRDKRLHMEEKVKAVEEKI